MMSHNQLVANEILNIIDFTRDYDLNIVCGDICIEETLKCVATCEPTDSHCLSACFRSQNVCFESKLLKFILNGRYYIWPHIIYGRYD